MAFAILLISIAKANLETVMKEEREGRLRVIPVEINNSVYYLPKIKIYPTHVLYPIKIWRDKLWLMLTRDACEKSKLLMLIADKQMAENDSISANEAVDNLIHAWEICPSKRLEINNVADVYRQITEKMRKYSQANEKINSFIETKKTITN